jgi:hypothetical protein
MFGGVASGILSSGLLLKLLPPVITFAMGKLSEKKEQKEEKKKSWWPFG